MLTVSPVCERWVCTWTHWAARESFVFPSLHLSLFITHHVLSIYLYLCFVHGTLEQFPCTKQGSWLQGARYQSDFFSALKGFKSSQEHSITDTWQIRMSLEVTSLYGFLGNATQDLRPGQRTGSWIIKEKEKVREHFPINQLLTSPGDGKNHILQHKELPPWAAFFPAFWSHRHDRKRRWRKGKKTWHL